MTQIALSVDSRGLPGGLFGSADLEAFVRAWRQVEDRLQDRTLSPGTVLPVTLDAGRLDFTVLSPQEPVTVGPDTEFGIVSVLERHRVHEAHGCATCARDGRSTYAPFVCGECPEEGHGVCDEHARLLPGGMAATCPAHEPACAACSSPAAARCPGPDCRSRTAWCAAHLQAHSSDPETGYCARCRDRLFPECGISSGCPGVGSVSCEHVEPEGRLCEARRCPRHAWRWQVFGPQQIGLGRCEAHSSTRADRAADVLYQILAACALKGSRLPTAPSLRHAVVKSTGQQVALRDVVTLAQQQPASAPPALRELLRDVVLRTRERWKDQASANEAGERRATEALLAWLTSVGKAEVAAALTVRNYAPAREARPAGEGRDAQEARNAALFVYCDRDLLPPRVRREAADALGFDVVLVR
ncbi:hypothetical protein ACU610_21545 [Geodermatophilus sp. URMC 61]|uniref:hypothetical protein n=1 Tax=Geodermatophilus sp. URMC 61 TaxID=3423411 RepID=UPI00406C0163